MIITIIFTIAQSVRNRGVKIMETLLLLVCKTLDISAENVYYLLQFFYVNLRRDTRIFYIISMINTPQNPHATANHKE